MLERRHPSSVISGEKTGHLPAPATAAALPTLEGVGWVMSRLPRTSRLKKKALPADLARRRRKRWHSRHGSLSEARCGVNLPHI
jgi:hypothetical protein